jgi:enterochelin esterase family protein
MTGSFQLNKTKIARRSLMSGAVMLGGSAALAAVVPSFSLATADAAEEIGPKRILHSATAFTSQNLVETSAESKGVRFSKDYLSNKVFQDQPLNFGPATPVHIDGKTLEVGALVQPSGDLLFRIYAPDAKEVRMKVSTGPAHIREFILTKQGDGIFSGLLSYDENVTGPAYVQVYVDGAIFLDPYLPIRWAGSGPRNIVEIPDSEQEFTLIKDVPHGAVGREIFWVDALKSWERYFVYTPAGYVKSTKEFPVLYLQHGGGENETTWVYTGRAAHILDNLIAEGKAEPFIVVMNNGMVRYRSSAANVYDEAFERMLIEGCIPHLEKNYRVKTDKWNRAIAGLSMGCYQSCDIAFRHPEMFGSLGTLNASMTHETFPTTYERPYPTVMKDPETFAKNYKLYFRSTMPGEDHFPYFLADDKICANAGIDRLPSYHRIVYPERTSKENGWRMGLRDFSLLLFR